MNYSPGDFVIHNNRVCTINGAHKNGCYLDDGSTFYSYDEITPIKFTRELLELNGYKEIYGTGIFENSDNNRIKIERFVSDEWNSSLMIDYVTATYVHQIQQFYRLMYNKEIFKSFKIK